MNLNLEGMFDFLIEFRKKIDAPLPNDKFHSHVEFEDDVMPFTFADLLILRYLMGITDASQTVKDYDAVNKAAELDWTFRSQLSRFIRRFLKDPYREEDIAWIRELKKKYGIKLEEKLRTLGKLL